MAQAQIDEDYLTEDVMEEWFRENQDRIQKATDQMLLQQIHRGIELRAYYVGNGQFRLNIPGELILETQGNIYVNPGKRKQFHVGTDLDKDGKPILKTEYQSYSQRKPNIFPRKRHRHCHG